ncbi:carboxypeptidase-like protein [Neolewinella xylanilytica]|uniref:Carboxypeptidase-like protein n=1 Tax=Neolewinella xylanilytica TaxID=1514080 RepID=A0A2S6I897_9BACT|nr:carboxypeptidase-like regulatory domain-containing protein [Neolewinella xylanilytica]PPK87727.1 carboxypeptidase-like protein [Neolewinella xylanilytica]
MRVILLFLLVQSSLPAQYRINGYVLDDVSGEPVPFASVFLEDNQGKGVLTNELGAFAITLDSTERHRGTLVFTSVAYAHQFVRLSEALPSPTAGEPQQLNIRLETQFVDLPGVTVLSDLGLRQLVRRALDRVPDNYGAEEYLIKAYHRSYFATNQGFAQLNEAYLTIKDEPYGGKSIRERDTRTYVDQMEVIKGAEDVPPHIRKFFDQQQFLTLGYNWVANQLYEVRLGPVFQPSTNDDLHQLTFRQIGEYLSGTDTLVRIRYALDSLTYAREQPEGQRPDHVGEVVINKTDLAFLEIKTLKEGDPTAIYTAYQKVNGKYYPQRSSFSWSLDQDFRQYPRIFNVFFYVTEVITDPREIKRYKTGKRLQGGEPMSALRIRHDPAFWQGEERMLQLPVDETLKFEMRNLLDLPETRQDSVSRDTSK